MENPICIIEKNSTQDVRVQLSEFRGRHYIDIRVFVVIDAVKRGPTRKGVTLAVGKLRQLIAGLQVAEREAQKAGLIEELNGEDRPQDNAAGAGEDALTILNGG